MKRVVVAAGRCFSGTLALAAVVVFFHSCSLPAQDTVPTAAPVGGDVPVSTEADTLAQPEAVDIPGFPLFEEGVKLFAAGDEAGALAKLEEFNTLQEVKTPPKVRLATLALQGGDPGMAQRLFDESTRDYPDAPEPYVILGNLDRASGRLVGASLLFARGLELADTLGDAARAKQSKIQVHTGLAQLATTREDFVALRHEAEAILAMDSESIAGLSFMANCLFEEGDVDGTLARLEEVKKLAPDAVISPKVTLALSFQNKGDAANAQKWMVEAVKEDLRSIPIRLAAADWAMQAGQIKQAAEQLDIALQLDAKSVVALHARGVAALIQKDYAKAEEFLSKADELGDGNPMLRNDLILALAMQNDPVKKQDAVGMAQANVQGHPNQAEAVGTFGWVLSRYGQSERAEQLLGQACSSGMPISENTLYFFARVLVDRGKKAESLMVLNTPAMKNSKFYIMKADADSLRTTLESDPTLRREPVTDVPPPLAVTAQ